MHLDASWFERMFNWLLQTSWQVSVVVCLILIVQFVFRKGLSPFWRYGLWMLVVVRLVMPDSIESTASIFNLTSMPTLQGITSGTSATATSANHKDRVTKSDEPSARSMEKISPLATSSRPTANVAEPQPASTSEWNVRQGFVYVWLFVMALLFARVLYKNYRFSSPVIRRRPVTDAKILDLLQDCKAELNVHVPMDLIETDKVDSPALLGIVRPRLLLPPNMLGSFSRDKLRYFFLHELYHFKRGDILVNWVMSILQVLHWFNPFVWLAFSRMRADREAACDARVIAHCGDEKEGRGYGEAILDVAEFAARAHWLPGVVGILEDKQQITRRITMIANYREYPRWTKVLAVGLTSALGILTLTDARSQQAEPAAAEQSAGKVEMSGQLVLIDSAAVPGIEKKLGMDLDPATGRTLLNEAEAAALVNALLENPSAHLVGEGSAEMNSGEAAVFKSVQDIAFDAPDRKIRQIGWILQGTVTRESDQVRATFSPEWVDHLGTRKVRDLQMPLFQTLNCAMDYVAPEGSYLLLRGSRAPLRDFRGVNSGDSLGAQLRDRSLDYFMLLSAKAGGTISNSAKPPSNQAMLVCRVFSLGPEAQEVLKKSTGMQSMSSSVSLSPKAYRDLLDRLAGTPDAQTLSSASIATSSKTHAQSQWTVEVIYWDGKKYETRKCGQIFNVTPVFNDKQSEMELSPTMELTFPPPEPSPADGFSALTIWTDRKMKLDAGQTTLSSLAAPSGILPQRYRCFMAITARALGDDTADQEASQN